ncbi:MAG TPA: hypothetical protein VGJ15_09860 [Pirellulales bacterium]|jgi:DNA-directed RNA polymerase subunit RPC12/RpoP
MAMEFICPNGHRIVCPEDRAGRDAKCPKCGVAMRIPTINGATAARINAGAAGESPSDSTTSQLRAENTPAAGAENNLVFLCPNGHRLNSPARLQGQPGRCPHCGAKFLIPTLAELQQVEEMNMANQSGQNFSQANMEATMPHPLCALLSKLWEERQHGAVVELHLDGGTLLVPDWFDEPHSQQSHALFAAQSADGTVTMTIVPWDNIMRVVVRNVEGLPEGMFEQST